MRGLNRLMILFTAVLVFAVVVLVVGNNKAHSNRSVTGIVSIADADSLAAVKENQKKLSRADSMISFSKSFMGLDYFYTGKSPKTGFDCSGFTHYIFKNFGIELSPASREQIHAGKRIDLKEAQTGDLLIFTGTRPAIRQPGHVGIVISRKGERPLKFIHSSSNGGVKISQVDGTSYAIRLLQVRRLL